MTTANVSQLCVNLFEIRIAGAKELADLSAARAEQELWDQAGRVEAKVDAERGLAPEGVRRGGAREGPAAVEGEGVSAEAWAGPDAGGHAQQNWVWAGGLEEELRLGEAEAGSGGALLGQWARQG